MTDVKELCEAVLDGPAPPLRTGAEALALARRSTRRRDARTIAGSGLAVLAIVALAAAGTTLVGPGTGVRASIAGTDNGAPTTSTPPLVALVPPPPVPTPEAATAHGPQVFAILTAAVPPGYTSRPQYDDPTSTWLLEGQPPNQYSTSTDVITAADGREGLLQAYVVRDYQPFPAGDLCSAEVAARTARMFGGRDAPCEAFVINGVPIRVTTEQDPERGEVKTAFRLLDAGMLAVVSQQGRVTYSSDSDLPPDAAHTPVPGSDHKPPLTTSMLSSRDVAVIAANPAMLP